MPAFARHAVLGLRRKGCNFSQVRAESCPLYTTCDRPRSKNNLGWGELPDVVELLSVGIPLAHLPSCFVRAQSEFSRDLLKTVLLSA